MAHGSTTRGSLAPRFLESPIHIRSLASARRHPYPSALTLHAFETARGPPLESPPARGRLPMDDTHHGYDACGFGGWGVGGWSLQLAARG